MKMLYIAKVDFNNENSFGVKKKVFEHIKVFKKHFHTDVIYIEDKNIILNNNVLETIDKNTPFKRRLSFYKQLGGIINNYDAIYLRSFIADRRINKVISNYYGHKVVEIPTNINALYKETNNIISKTLIKIYQKKFLEKFDQIILNGNLSDFEKKLKKDVSLIQNGISLNKLPIKHNFNEKSLNLLSIANNSKWHGYDRIIKGLYEYYKKNPNKEVYYHCVGEGSELDNLKELAKELNLEKYVIFYGTKTGEELSDIVNKSDLAIGSLGMYRIDLEYASTLKLREYCARGIPFVYAYNDFDFDDFKYSMKIESNEKPVNINDIIIFYNSIKNENYIEEMRKYAEENLTWDAKMKPVIEKINELIKERNFDK